MSAHRQRDRQRRPPRVRGQQFAWASVVVIVLATTAVIALGAGYGQSVESGREQGRSGATTSGETGTSPEVGVEVDPGTRVGEEQLPRRGGPPRVLITVGLLGLPIAVSIGAALVTDPRRAIVGRTAAVVVLLLWTLLFIASVGVLYAIAAGLMAASAALSRTPVGPDPVSQNRAGCRRAARAPGERRRGWPSPVQPRAGPTPGG
jgi:hypothetical protein